MDPITTLGNRWIDIANLAQMNRANAMREMMDQLHEMLTAPHQYFTNELSAAILGDYNAPAFAVVALALFWGSILLAGWYFYRTCCHWMAACKRRVRSALFRARTAHACRKAQEPLSPQEVTTGSTIEMELNEIDLAVLSSAAVQSHGFNVSAPELAESLRSPPDRIQRSLEKLVGHALLDRGFGTVDDYANYRITQSGSTIIATWHSSKA